MNTSSKILAASLFLLAGLAQACGGAVSGGPGGSAGSGGSGGSPQGGSISASSYDQDCVQETDCAPVFEGTPTYCPSCDNAAINTQALSSYDRALAAITPSCSQPPDSNTGLLLCACPAIACVPPHIACVAGKCAVVALDASCGGPDGAFDSDGGAPEAGEVDGGVLFPN